MKVQRRLSLQLTPLLDMLLIIIFAQYMQVRDQQIAVAQRMESSFVERDEARQRSVELAAQLELLRRAAEIAESNEALAIRSRDEQSRKLEQFQADLDRTLAQQRVLGELVVELFQVPPEEITRILDPSQFPSGTRTPEELQRLRERFRSLSLERAGQMIEHLLSYEEIRKRCDVWDLHVDAGGVATITAGDNSTRIRINLDAAGNVQSEQFIAEVYNWYRGLPQPKSLVVILLTYDRASRIFVTEAVRQALPQLVTRMQADSTGRIRFEYADLGFRIE